MDAAVEAAPVQPVVYVNSCSHVHWTATASSSSGLDVPSRAIDGYPQTRFGTGKDQSGNDFLQIDLGAPVTLSQIVLDNSGGFQDDYPRGYSVFLSTDGVTFPTMVAMATVTMPPGPTITIPFPSQAARAVKIVNTGTFGLWWSVDEVRLTCQLLTPPPQGAIYPYDPISWKATATSSDVGAPPTNAFDGNLLSRWSTGQYQAGEKFVLDLGATVSVSQVSLEAGGSGDFPVMYTLEISADGQAYQQVAAGAGAPFTQIQFARKNARFLRIGQTGANQGHWWSIYELTIKP
jgi:beta-glucosidase